MRAHTMLLVAIAGCGSSAPAQTSDTPKARDQKAAAFVEDAATDPVSATLVADRTRIVPGEKLTLAVQLDMASEWHVYWKNPGESGLETDVQFAVPDGFAAGPLRYPGPVRFESAGDIVSYGYPDRVLLSAEVKAPATIAEKTVKLSAEASWVACRADRCIRGTAAPSLTLPVASADAPAKSANQALFDRHRERLPKPFSHLAAALYAPKAKVGGSAVDAVSKRRDGDTAVFTMHVRGAEAVDFFPDRDTPLASSEVNPVQDGQELRLFFEADKTATVGGVIQIRTADGVRYYRYDDQIPSAKSKP